MTVIAVCSVKHSPGATTLGLALVAAWVGFGRTTDERATLIEADPAGGDLGARVGLELDPGLVSMAAGARHPGSDIDIVGHARPLPCGGAVVLGPASSDQAEAAVATVAARLPHALRALGNGVVDCGRWTRTSPTNDTMRLADYTIVVVRPDLAGVAHLQERIEPLLASSGGRLGVVLVGERPYRVGDVATATGIRNVTTIPVDRHGVDALHGAVSQRVARSSPLIRAARSILDAVTETTAEAVFA